MPFCLDDMIFQNTKQRVIMRKKIRELLGDLKWRPVWEIQKMEFQAPSALNSCDLLRFPHQTEPTSHSPELCLSLCREGPTCCGHLVIWPADGPYDNDLVTGIQIIPKEPILPLPPDHLELASAFLSPWWVGGQTRSMAIFQPREGNVASPE